MGLWTQQAGIWTLQGDGVRTAVVSNDPATGNYSIRVQFKNPANLGGVIIKSSHDGRTCYQIDTDSGTGGNLQIRLATFGALGAALASAAHGLTTAVPYTLEVRLEQGVIKVRVNGIAADIFTYDPGTTLSHQDFWGFVGTVDQMKVLDAEIGELVTQNVERADVLCVVGGGEAWQCEDGLNLERVGTGPVMRSFGPVDIAEFEQKARMVDGANARVWDVALRTVTKYTTTSPGLLPGSATTTDGKTSATIIERVIGRLAFAGMKDDPQNLYETAPNDPSDLDTGVFPVGSGAFALTAADAAKVGEPIRGLLGASRSRLVIGCQRSFWEMLGDPAIGAVEVNPTVSDAGLSGKDAMLLIDTVRIAAHSQAGLILVPGSGSEPVYVSRGILTDLIQFVDALENYTVILVRDPQRHGTHVFLTARVSGPSTHFWYDERIGDWSGGKVIDGAIVSHPGGFFPETYPDRIGPTAACYWNGKVVLGGRDGYLYEFDPTGTLDEDDGDDIEWTLTTGLLAPDELDSDIIVPEMVFQTADDCDPFTLTIYGAHTAEQVYDENERWTVLTEEVDPTHHVVPHQVRSPVLVAVLTGTGRFGLEAADFEWTVGPRTPNERDEEVDQVAVAPTIPPFAEDPPVEPETMLVGVGIGFGEMTGLLDRTGGDAAVSSGSAPGNFNTGSGAVSINVDGGIGMVSIPITTTSDTESGEPPVD